MITTHHILLAIASVALCGVIAAQDYLWPPLRQETISTGLTGPYHWWLDASYLLLAIALAGAFREFKISEAIAIAAGVSLILTAATNTFSGLVDKLTNGQHSLWHSRFTTAVFVSALALEVSANHGAALWSITAANCAAPAVMYALSGRSDYTEKVGVLLICVWLIAWAL